MKKQNEVFVQFFASKVYFDKDDVHPEAFGGVWNEAAKSYSFETLDKATAFVESVKGSNGMELEVLEDNSKETKHGYAVDIDYTAKKGIFKGLIFATVWNIAKVDSYFLD